MYTAQSPIRDAARRLVSSGATLVLVPQVLIEYWAVATRPAASNGLGLAPGLVSPDAREVYAELRAHSGLTAPICTMGGLGGTVRRGWQASPRLEPRRRHARCRHSRDFDPQSRRLRAVRRDSGVVAGISLRMGDGARTPSPGSRCSPPLPGGEESCCG